MSAKVAIVAGAGGALGHATAVTLAAVGLTVVAVDRSERGLGDFPGSVRPEVANAADPAAAKSLVDRIAGEVGPPDVLVNTIGAFRPGDALTTTPETLQLMIDVNLGPALWLSQAVAPHMQQQGSGAMVHVAARPGIEPSGGMAAYSASRCGGSGSIGTILPRPNVTSHPRARLETVTVRKRRRGGGDQPSRTTRFTSRPGTTISLTTVAPSMCAATLGTSRAAASTVSFGASGATSTWPRSLPLTWTA